MNPILTAMRSLTRHDGMWEGSYHLIDHEGKTLVFHQSRVEVRFPELVPYHYTQKNHFWWPDGREVGGEDPAVWRDGILQWDNALIRGTAWAVDELSTVLTWQRHDTPGAYLHELIVINKENNQRSRTWR